MLFHRQLNAKTAIIGNASKNTESILSDIGSNSKRYLDSIKSVIGSETSQRNINSSKMIESLDVKATKSILLRANRGTLFLLAYDIDYITSLLHPKKMIITIIL